MTIFTPYILVPVGLFYLFTKLADIHPRDPEYTVAGLIVSALMFALCVAVYKTKNEINAGMWFWPVVCVLFMIRYIN